MGVNTVPLASVLDGEMELRYTKCCSTCHVSSSEAGLELWTLIIVSERILAQSVIEDTCRAGNFRSYQKLLTD